MLLLAGLTVAALLSGCSSLQHPSPSSDITHRQEISGFPYHPLVFHLDLSTLAYHLYAQTLVWPFDPYYEAVPGGEAGRARFMNDVRKWASDKGREDSKTGKGLTSYRGPGRLAAFEDNPLHDPIVYRYDGLSPWNRTITNAGSRWVEYLPSAPITDQIRNVYMCNRTTRRTPDAVSVKRVASNSAKRASGAKDVLFAFEGATGDKGEEGHPASQSLLGFVLLRHRTKASGYDIHIVFRGSRSGSLLRSVAQANWDVRASGNPDWITDLGYALIGPGKSANIITTVGSVHRGFAKSMELTLPNIFACLNKAAALKPGTRPENIYVTGHSLGGGLAQHFVSAMILGDQYGPAGKGPQMPPRLQKWPWQNIKLITFSAPRAGDPVWAETLTTKGLASEFHARDRLRYDQNALAPNDPDILVRLGNRDATVGYRVLVSTDPVSTSAVPGRKPVGKTIYADRLGPLAIAAPYSPDSHEPGVVRDLMVSSLNDPGIPTAVWRYQSFAEAENADSRKKRSKSVDYTQLQAEFLNYLLQDDPDFDSTRYMREFAIFNQILDQQ